MNLQYWVLALIVSAVFGAFVYFAKNKKTRKVLGIIAIIGLATAGITGFAFPDRGLSYSQEGGVTFAITDTGEDTGGDNLPDLDVDVTGCDLGTKTTVTLTALNKYTQEGVGGSHRCIIENSAPLTVSDAGTFTASPGQVLKILWNNASTTSNYFSSSQTYTVPCTGAYPVTEYLYKNGSITIQVFNEDGNSISAVDGTNESLAVGDVVTLEAKLKGTYQTAFPYGGVIVAEYNDSAYDDVVVDFGGDKVSVPESYAVNLSGTDRTQKAYSVNALFSNEIKTGSVVIDVDDTFNPGPVREQEILLTFLPNNLYINEDNGGSYDGPAVSDEDGKATYGHSTQFDLSVE